MRRRSRLLAICQLSSQLPELAFELVQLRLALDVVVHHGHVAHVARAASATRGKNHGWPAMAGGWR
eukprot:1559183-Pleurochrysis_carterae.AAC.2